MKYFAIFSVLVLIVALVGTGYLYMTSNIVVEASGVIATDAPSQLELFNSLKTQMRLGSVVGTPYVPAQELTQAEDYQFFTYTLRLKNNTTAPVDMIEVQVTPMAGDILQIGSFTDVKLPAGQTVDVSATILTHVNMHSIREVCITYYIWGVPFSMKATIQ